VVDTHETLEAITMTNSTAMPMPNEVCMLLEMPKNEHSAMKRINNILLTIIALEEDEEQVHVREITLASRACMMRFWIAHEEPEHEERARRQDEDEHRRVPGASTCRPKHRPVPKSSRTAPSRVMTP